MDITVKLPYGADPEIFEKVVTYLHQNYDPKNYKLSRITRDKLLKDVFNIDKNDPQYEKIRHDVELAARASKTDAGMDYYNEINGQKGFIQATVVNRKSFYEAVISSNVVKYNPRNKEDVSVLVAIASPLIIEKPNASAEEIASTICRTHGYVIGSILPSIGTIRARYNSIVMELNEKLNDAMLVNRGLIFASNKKLYLKLTEKIFNENVHTVSHNELVELILDKLKRK